MPIKAVDRSAGDFQTRSTLKGPKSIGYEYVENGSWLKEAQQRAELVGVAVARF